MRFRAFWLLAGLCFGCGDPGEDALTVSGSTLGAEGEVLRRQVGRFQGLHPEVRVEVQQTPDDATQRHQLYVQWLNARVGRPDVLQLDVVWTAEFAGGGWLLPLDRFAPRRRDLFSVSLAANTWQGRLYALPWFLDAGMLYWRTDHRLPGDPRGLRRVHPRARPSSAASSRG